jgi:hypothetical protein
MTLSFFRRHRKWFMVLMFLSLFGILIFGWWHNVEEKISMWLGSHPTMQRVGTIAGKMVRENEVQQFFAEVKAAGEASQIMAMALGEKAAAPDARMRLYVNTVGATAWSILASTVNREKPDRLTLMTWLALYQEARQQGFDASPAQIDARLRALEELGLAPDLLKQIVGRTAAGQKAWLLEAMRKDMTLRTYINWLSEVLAGAVEPEMRREFARLDERLKVRLEVLKAADALPEIKDVPGELLAQQFQKYKAFLPGQSPEGYGYRIPDRVTIEYLAADAAAFEDQARPKVADADIANYYESHKDEFVVKEEKPAAAEKPEKGAKGQAGDKGDKPEKKDEAAPPETKYRPLQEVRAEIAKTLLRKEAAGLARERLNSNAAEIRALKKAPDLRIWADGKLVRYEAVKDFKTSEEIAQIKGLGQATRGKEPMPAAAVLVAGLVPAAKVKLAVMEISDVYTDPDGNAYVFRVTSTEPNHEPADLKDARDRVLADVRGAKAFDLVRERAKALLDAAAAKGLEAAAKDAKLKPPAESDWFAREKTIRFSMQVFTLPATLPEVGANRLVVAECFRMAADGRQRTMVTLAEEREVVLAELVGRKEPREAAYQRDRPVLADRVGRQVAEIALRQAIDLGSIQRRMKVVCELTGELRRPRGGEDEPPDDGARDEL